MSLLVDEGKLYNMLWDFAEFLSTPKREIEVGKEIATILKRCKEKS